MMSELHDAALYGRKDTFNALLAAGADPNSTDDCQRTPLHKAACHGNTDIVKALLAAGAEVDAPDIEQVTPLQDAAFCSNDQADAVEVLIAAGADPNAVGMNGKTPLHQACWNGNINVVRVLLAAGANPNAADFIYRQTPLIEAVNKVQGVISRSSMGGFAAVTPEYIATYADITQALLAAGADPNAADSLRRRALDYARMNGDTVITRILNEASADS